MMQHPNDMEYILTKKKPAYEAFIVEPTKEQVEAAKAAREAKKPKRTNAKLKEKN